jgi:tetratricopeptide (TPR) repeat protein
MENNKCRNLEYNRLCKEKKWDKARLLLLEWLKDEPDDHWLLTNIGETYFEEKNYTKALEYEQEALKLHPYCPLVLWDYANSLDMLERYEDAIPIYKKLIKRGVKRIAYGKCGEGISSARMLVNDCRYNLGLVYATLGDFDLAIRFVRMHIANRDRKTRSIYNLHYVKKDLQTIFEGQDFFNNRANKDKYQSTLDR